MTGRLSKKPLNAVDGSYSVFHKSAAGTHGNGSDGRGGGQAHGRDGHQTDGQ